MNTTIRRNSVLVCALLGVMVASLAQGATFRYIGSGDYTNISTGPGITGWYQSSTPETYGIPPAPPNTNTIRFNYGGGTVTLATEVPDVRQFQAGVDESGYLVISNGGKLKAVGTSANAIGYNGGTVVGGLTIYAGGELVSSNSPLEVGRLGIGNVLIDGGTLTLNHHLWVGSGGSSGIGTIIITNGGAVNFGGTNGNGMLGLGTINATSASGGTGIIKVQQGGALHLYNISSTAQNSIWGASYLDISGNGVVTIPGDRAATMTNYVNAGKIIAYGGTGTVLIDYNNTNPGYTTLTAIGGYTPPTDLTWDPAGNPSTTGLWSENANWSPDRYKPVATTKVSFNTNGAIPCILNDSGAASCILMGQDGPGGTLIVTNGGTLGIDAGDSTYIGYNSNAVMVVAQGATVSFGTNVYIGLDPGSDGTLIMNGGTVSVAGTFYMGYQGGKGTAQIKGGTLNVSLWDDYFSIQGESVVDVTGTGKVVINGNRTISADYFISTGQLTNSSGTGLVVDYDIINVGKTTIYPVGLVLPPAQAVWNPAANPSGNGLWDESANWTVGLCPGGVTVVTFNVLDAIPCIVTNAATAGYIAMGNSGGPGGTLIITNGGSLTTFANNWCAVGYSSNALMIVENGGSASFASHLWVGLDPGSDGTFVLNGGTVSVGQMFGMGWQGGTGTAQINGGTLNLAQWHPTDSIKGASVLNLSGTGTVLITGNYLSSISNFVVQGKIVAPGGAANVVYGFDPAPVNKTIIQVAPARQSITAVDVSGGNTTLTYQTAAEHYYHIESSPTLPATTWTRVNSSAKATGTSATFSFPTSGGQMFYRTVSP